MVYVYFSDGFEEVEAITIIDFLRRGGVSVKSVSITKSLTVVGDHGIPIVCDALFEEVDHSECEMMVIPGGWTGTQGCLAHQGLKTELLKANEEKKWIGAICAAPMVLISHGIMEGKKGTIYPGIEKDFPQFDYINEAVVVSENIITSRGPGTATKFALRLLTILKGDKIAGEVETGLVI